MLKKNFFLCNYIIPIFDILFSQMSEKENKIPFISLIFFFSSSFSVFDRADINRDEIQETPLSYSGFFPPTSESDINITVCTRTRVTKK